MPKAKRPPLPEIPTIAEMAERIDLPVEAWHHQCHAVSITIVKAGVFGPSARVARGHAAGVPGQHSWIFLGTDPYAAATPVIDPTMWTYQPNVQGIWAGHVDTGVHKAKGYGPPIMSVGRPAYPTGEIIPLSDAGYRKLGSDGRFWVDEMFGPLDLRGWMELMNMTMVGWASGEVIAAMLETPRLAVHVPIDLAGMLTDTNPSNLYLPSASEPIGA